MNRSKLYNLSFHVKRIQFEPKIITECEVITVNVTFLDHPQQMLFEPVIPPASGTLFLNAGKTFTFGLNHDTECDLAKNFVIKVNLEQTDLKKCLSETQIDLTNIFRGVYKNRCPSNMKTQTDAAVEFVDDAGETVARADVTVRLFPSGPTIVNEFVLNGDHRKHRISVRDARGRCRHPAAAGRGRRDDDEGEWDVVCAELDNGQKIAVKYNRCYYGLLPAAGEDDDDDDDGRCADSRSDERLDGRVFELMRGVHEAIARTAAERRGDDDDGSGSRGRRTTDEGERLSRAREPADDEDDDGRDGKEATSTALGSAAVAAATDAKPDWNPKRRRHLGDGGSGGHRRTA